MQVAQVGGESFCQDETQHVVKQQGVAKTEEGIDGIFGGAAVAPGEAKSGVGDQLAEGGKVETSGVAFVSAHDF